MVGMTAHLLKQKCDIYRRTEVADGQGGFTYSYSAVKLQVRCKIDQASAKEQIEAEQAGASLTHKIYLDPDQTIRRGDEIRRTGHVYRVGSVVESSSSNVYRRADSELIQPEGSDV